MRKTLQQLLRYIEDPRDDLVVRAAVERAAERPLLAADELLEVARVPP